MTEIGTSWLGSVPGDDRRGLVVAQHDEHEIRRRRSAARRRTGRSACTRSTGRTPPYPLRSLQSAACSPRPPAVRLKTEPSPTSLQSISGGMRVHGAWLDTRSTSAKTGRRSGFASSRRCRAERTYWSGIGGVRELRAAIPDVAPVVDLVVVVERRPLRPVPVVRRHVVDGPPPGPLERLAEREAVARDELVVAPLAVDPDPRLQRGVRQPADAAERRRGEAAAPGGEAGGLAAASSPASRTASTRGENEEPSTATLP